MYQTTQFSGDLCAETGAGVHGLASGLACHWRTMVGRLGQIPVVAP